MPGECSHCICLSVILNDSVFKMSEKYHTEVVLEKWEYIFQDKKINRSVNGNLETYSDDSDTETSDKETDKD